MQIHCTIATKDREVEIDGTTYLFTANDAGDYVADVKKKTHAQKLLRVAEAFELYDFDEEDEDDDEDKAPAPAGEGTSGKDPDAASLEAIERANEAAAAQAIADAKAKAAAEADDFEEDGADKVEDAGDTGGDAPTLEEMLGDPSLITVAIVKAAADAELEFLFQAVSGRPPHPKAKPPKIRATLIEELNARDAA